MMDAREADLGGKAEGWLNVGGFHDLPVFRSSGLMRVALEILAAGGILDVRSATAGKKDGGGYSGDEEVFVLHVLPIQRGRHEKGSSTMRESSERAGRDDCQRHSG